MFDYLSKHCPTDNRQEFWQHGPMNSEQADKLAHGSGFVAALDQSGGTPKALRLYGIADGAYSGDAQMFDLVHQMRTRSSAAPASTAAGSSRRSCSLQLMSQRR
jgi:hypothetical protein